MLRVLKRGSFAVGLAIGLSLISLHGAADFVCSGSTCPTGAVIYVQELEPAADRVTVGHFWLTPSTQTIKMATAVGPLAWTTVNGTGGTGGDPVPTGSILMVDSGACPTGYAEDASLAGRMPLGTLAANGDVGATGGSDTLTPAGSVTAPTVSWPGAVPTHSGITASFTGSALATHQHELPFQAPTTTTTRQIAAATFGTGTSRAATAVSAAGTANTTSAAVLKDQPVSAGTPAGTVSITNQGTVAWPASVPTASVPTFTGTSADNRSAFAKVLFCRKS